MDLSLLLNSLFPHKLGPVLMTTTVTFDDGNNVSVPPMQTSPMRNSHVYAMFVNVSTSSAATPCTCMQYKPLSVKQSESKNMTDAVSGLCISVLTKDQQEMDDPGRLRFSAMMIDGDIFTLCFIPNYCN